MFEVHIPNHKDAMFSFSLASAFLIGLVAFGITYLLMPAVRRVAFEKDWVDAPDGKRKIHRDRMPRVGGLAIWFGIVGGLLVTILMGRAFEAGDVAGVLSMRSVLCLMAGATIVVATGLLDDIFQIRARYKLLGQFLAFVPVLLCGEVVAAVATLLGGGTPATILAFPLIIGWGMFIMNAVNLLDGMDGLAGGVTLIALLFLALMGGMGGMMLLFLMTAAGAVMAFLRYNLPPAKVFMGDTGSLLLGYLLGVFALVSLVAEPTVSRMLALLVMLGLPILDTGMTIARRIARKRDPFAPDREHLHHRVLGRMFGHQPRALLVFYLLGIGLGLFALLIDRSELRTAALLTALVAGLGLFMLWELDYFDRASYRRHVAPQGKAPEEEKRKPLRKTQITMKTHLRGPVRHRPPIL